MLPPKLAASFIMDELVKNSQAAQEQTSVDLPSD